MLRDKFYSVVQQSVTETGCKARIRLNADHDILKGHFPGKPIVPGVCMIQMVKELAESHFGKRFQLSEGDNIKFLTVIEPANHPEFDGVLDTKAEDGSVVINASLQEKDVTFFKIKAVLRERE